jgi:carbonic anhydrase
MQEGMKPEDAMKELIEGNKRYVGGKPKFPNTNAKRRTEVAKGQHPFAIVLGCSDSRVPPEVIFDRGLGDLFIVRTAGNVVDDIAIGSIEYAAEHLGVQLIVVLGHSKCGAVDATMKGGEAPGHIGSIVKKLRPPVDAAKGKSGDAWLNCVNSNIDSVVKELEKSTPILSELVEKGKLKITGATYCVDSGAVMWNK